jgi:hypothetical protein
MQVIEVDPVVVQLGKTYFDVSEDASFEVSIKPFQAYRLPQYLICVYCAVLGLFPFTGGRMDGWYHISVLPVTGFEAIVSSCVGLPITIQTCR